MTEQEIRTVPDSPLERPTITVFLRTLTGFDELAIEQKFHRNLGDLTASMMIRALAFIVFRRRGMDDTDAYQEVMAGPFGAMDDLFSSDPDGEDEGKA